MGFTETRIYADFADEVTSVFLRDSRPGASRITAPYDSSKRLFRVIRANGRLVNPYRR